MSNDIENVSPKDRKGIWEKIKYFCRKIIFCGSYICNSILFLLLISLIIDLFLYIGFIIYNKTGTTDLAQGLGLIFAALISVAGVLAGFRFNKKQTYKEIVTKERTLWLNKLKDKLSHLLAILDVYDGLLNKTKYKVRAKDLFYNIITNLNVNYEKNSNNSTEEEDRRKEEVVMNREAIIYLYLYANAKGLEVDLNFEDEEKIKECEEKINKYAEKDGKGKLTKLEYQKAARKEALEKFTKIYKTVWGDIKGEAD